MKNLLENIEDIKVLLAKKPDIVVLTHHNPDGDAIGSALALYDYLLKGNHSVSIITPNKYPSFLSWLKNSDKILVYQDSKDQVLSKLKNAEIIFCVDFNAPKRVEDLSALLLKSKAIKILIDHHIDSVKFCDYVYSDVNTSSTAELLYDFFIAFGAGNMLDKQIAEALYVGIMTDTGSFSYSCNNAKTFLIISSLIKLGIDADNIHNLVYNNFSENRIRLLGHSLTKGLKVLQEYHTAYIVLTRADLKKYNFQIGDTEGFVNYTLSIEGINFGALFVERSNYIKISFRSKGKFSVNDFAGKHFNGGGHHNAAGGYYYKSLDETIEKFEKLLPEYKDILKNIH